MATNPNDTHTRKTYENKQSTEGSQGNETKRGRRVASCYGPVLGRRRMRRFEGLARRRLSRANEGCDSLGLKWKIQQ